MTTIYVYISKTDYRTCTGGTMTYTIDAFNNLFVYKNAGVIRFFAVGTWKEVVCS
jgi:hypothetical protein